MPYKGIIEISQTLRALINEKNQPWQSFIFTSQSLPVYPLLQTQVKLLMPSWHTPLLQSDGDVQSLMLVSQSLPVKPIGHEH